MAAILDRVAGLLGGKRKGPEPGTITPQEGTPREESLCPCGCGRDLGPNNENLEDVHPQVASALRELMLGYRIEGIISRRWEARKAKDAHLAWMGIQNGFYNAADWQIHLPYGTSVGLGLGIEDTEEDYESPSYDYVTNYYQAYGQAFQALMTARVPTPKFAPKSAQKEQDLTTQKAADDIRKLIEKYNPPKKRLGRYAWLGWCEGKIGGYVRWVVDGERFGYDEVPIIETDAQKIGEDAYICPNCGAENAGEYRGDDQAMTCQECGAAIGPEDFKMAEYAEVPRQTGVNRVPRGMVVWTPVPGLEFHTPPWAAEQHEFPYLQWNLEVHKAKLKAAYPKAADKIGGNGPILADDAQIRIWRLQVAQGFPVQMPADALANLITFSRSWMRTWAFWEIEDKQVRDLCLKIFPDGCYCAFAGETYCESRNESMDKHWRVSHLLEGDGQNRPGVGDSSLAVNKQINDLSNIEQEAADYGIGITFADGKVVNQDAIGEATARPGDIVPTPSLPAGQALAEKFFQTQPAQVSQQAVARRQELQGPTLQFLTGLEPAALGAADETNQTAEGRNVARETALGRLALFYNEMARFYWECMLLGVRQYAENATDDAEIPTAREGGSFESRYIRMADLQGDIELMGEPDDGFPSLPSEVRAVVQQMMQDPQLGPMITKSAANLSRAKDMMGLDDFKVPGEDMRVKTLRIIAQLLKSGPVQPQPQMAVNPQTGMAEPVQQAPQPTVTIDASGLDDALTAIATLQEWYQSDAGQDAELQNPQGIENVRAFYNYCKQIAAQQAQQTQTKPPSESMNFKDLPPEGQAQMAAQAGIKLDPAQLAAQDAAEKQQKAQQNAVKLAALHKGAQRAQLGA